MNINNFNDYQIFQITVHEFHRLLSETKQTVKTCAICVSLNTVLLNEIMKANRSYTANQSLDDIASDVTALVFV